MSIDYIVCLRDRRYVPARRTAWLDTLNEYFTVQHQGCDILRDPIPESLKSEQAIIFVHTDKYEHWTGVFNRSNAHFVWVRNDGGLEDVIPPGCRSHHCTYSPASSVCRWALGQFKLILDQFGVIAAAFDYLSPCPKLGEIHGELLRIQNEPEVLDDPTWIACCATNYVRRRDYALNLKLPSCQEIPEFENVSRNRLALEAALRRQAEVLEAHPACDHL